MEKEYQEIVANDLKPGDILVNVGELNEIILTKNTVQVQNTESAIYYYSYNKFLLIEKREPTMEELENSHQIRKMP